MLWLKENLERSYADHDQRVGDLRHFCCSMIKFYVTTTYVINCYHCCLFLDPLLVTLAIDKC
jgi:hypothetical protein